MKFLIGIHTENHKGTFDIAGKLNFVMTGIKILTLPEMICSDIMFRDYNSYSNEELYSLLDSVVGWDYSTRVYRDKDILYMPYYCKVKRSGGVKLFRCSSCIPLFYDDKLINGSKNKLGIFSNNSLFGYNISIYVNLDNYKVGVCLGESCIYGELNFKSLYYDFELDERDNLKDSYIKSFLKIYIGDVDCLSKDIIPVDYIDRDLVVIGNKSLLAMKDGSENRSIIVPNGVEEMLLHIDEFSLSNKALLIFPPSIKRLVINEDSIYNYSSLNIKFIFSKKSKIDNILYYLYRVCYMLPRDLFTEVKNHRADSITLSHRDRILDYIKINKDKFISLLISAGLDISFYE